MNSNLNPEDITIIESAVERVLHRSGLINGHPLTPSERQGIAIRTAIDQCNLTVSLLLTLARNSSSQEFKSQCNKRAQLLGETAEALGKEFRL